MPDSFDAFLETFIGGLSRDNLYQGRGLLEHLGPDWRGQGGDEQSFVDQIVATHLFDALGYEQGERIYNEQRSSNRPDFVIQVPGYPRPCFIEESKSTNTGDLAGEALPQLERYLRAFSAPQGLLLNGKQLLAYDLAEPAPVLVADLPLADLVAAWRGESLLAAGKSGPGALDDPTKRRLGAFWTRFRREAFVEATRLVTDLAERNDGTPYPTAPEADEWPTGSRIHVQRPGDNPAAFRDALIANARALIAEVTADAETQLSARLGEHAAYRERVGQLPGAARPVAEEFASLVNAFAGELERDGFEAEQRRAWRDRLEGQLARLTERDLVGGLGGEVLAAKNERVRAANEVARARRQGEHRPLDALIEGAGPAPGPRVERLRAGTSLPRLLEEPLKGLEVLLATYHEHREALLERSGPAVEVAEAFAAWRDKVGTLLIRGGDEARLKREFAAQTAYVLVVRMLLVRIAEDKGLLPRVFTNGGASLWFREVEPRYLKFAQGQGTEYLLEMAYASAQRIYAHFYSGLLFDWYKPDRNLVVRVLHRLAGFDLSQINDDIIGHVYGRYVEDEHKHESGMYYTPPEVVEYMLDRLGFAGPGIIGKTILDPACGSGTFLVSAARRIVEAYRVYYGGAIPPEKAQEVVDAVKNSVYGLDLNPFACSLAETNLLIQVLEPVKNALLAGENVQVDRFHVYNTDTLRPSRTAHAIAGGIYAEQPEFAESLPEAEQVKLGLGRHAEGFDFVVANPPYVRADEGGEGLLAYRREVKLEHPISVVRRVSEMKWDLFVPFVALSQHLLKPEGKMAMITSNALEMVPYAQALRESLATHARLEELSFYPGVRLFADAAVENTVFIAANATPAPEHEVLRRWHAGRPLTVVREERRPQLEHGEKVFRQSIAEAPPEGTVRLEDICYISVGMVLNADEKRFPGEFKKDDLISSSRDVRHPVAYVEGKDIDSFELTDLRYLEYGPELRAPVMIRRPTFPELYDRPKLIAQRKVSNAVSYVSEVVFDDGTWSEGFLFTHENGIIVMPWHHLTGISNRSIGDGDRKAKEELSVRFGEYFLMGVLNSLSVSTYLKSARRHPIDIFPDDFKKVVIPSVDLEQQADVATRARQLNRLGHEFFDLRRQGCVVDTFSATVRALTQGLSRNNLKLPQAKVRWGIQVADPNVDLTGLQRRGRGLARGRQVVLEVPEGTPEAALEWLRRWLGGLELGTTWAMAEARGLEVTASPEEAARAMAELEAKEAEVRAKLEEFHRLRREVDELVAELYAGA